MPGYMPEPFFWVSTRVIHRLVGGSYIIKPMTKMLVQMQKQMLSEWWNVLMTLPPIESSKSGMTSTLPNSTTFPLHLTISLMQQFQGKRIKKSWSLMVFGDSYLQADIFSFHTWGMQTYLVMNAEYYVKSICPLLSVFIILLQWLSEN